MTGNEKIQKIKELRAICGVGLQEAKNAIETADGDMEEAKRIVLKGGKVFSARQDVWQEIFTYNHNGRIAAMVVLSCSTDFTARTSEFQQLGKDLVQHVVGYDDDGKIELYDQPFIKDSTRTIKQLIDAVTVKTGEQISVPNFFKCIAKRTGVSDFSFLDT